MRDRKEVEMIKKMYPVGTRIKLNYMEDSFSKIEQEKSSKTVKDLKKDYER